MSSPSRSHEFLPFFCLYILKVFWLLPSLIATWLQQFQVSHPVTVAEERKEIISVFGCLLWMSTPLPETSQQTLPHFSLTINCPYLHISLGEGNGTPLQYSCLENPMDREAWWAVVHGVTRSRTQLSDFTFTFHFHALQKEMAAHSSVLAWRIPGMGEPGGLPSLRSHRVRHDWSYLAAAYIAGRWMRFLFDK